ncbi:MAG: SAM-dependent methyltransferase [Lentisphaerae bacterium GWF2_45_14]|nr:MAG: SAM-dependent methyltransferase [Lentisphaerae bacterium GWF2_45_14]
MNIFDEHYEEYEAWYDNHEFAFLSELEALKMAVPGKGEGLEIGAGTGRFAASLGIADGIDPSTKMLELARQKGVDVKLGNGEKLPFPDNAFDYVAIINTLCFVKKPITVLKEAGRVLKSNGEIILGIIDKNNFLGRFYQEKKSRFYGHAHFFMTEEVVELLRQAGFKKFSFWQTLFAFPDEISEIEKPLEGFDHGGFVVIKAEISN